MGGGGGERERERNIYTKRLSKQTISGCTCVKFSLRRRMLLDPRKHIRDERRDERRYLIQVIYLFFFIFFLQYDRKQGKGKFSQGKGGTKTCHDRSIGSCVRASVTEARVTV